MRPMMLATVTALVLATGLLSAAGAARRSCRALCKETVRACVVQARVGLDCRGLPGKAKRECKRELRGRIKACTGRSGHIYQACLASTNPTGCSPSGAFVE